MKKQIVRVAILQNAKVMAALYFVISLPLVALTALPLMTTGQWVGGSLLVMLLMPLLYTALGFVFTLFGAWVYNMVAARVGGFEFTTSELGHD
ncbi:hypothetical protein [Massilia suwonensis]|uniref:DUF3566 domain-containing protein n=1 Tax=Massilia suwonensis TaxID=648895 RepID=A0ABW0MRP1_9BURK